MENLLGSAGEQQNGHIDYSSAINAVNSFFEKNITFNQGMWFCSGRKRSGKLFPYRIRKWIRYILCIRGSSDVPLLRNPFPLCGRICDHTGGSRGCQTGRTDKDTGFQWTCMGRNLYRRNGWVPIEVSAGL